MSKVHGLIKKKITTTIELFSVKIASIKSDLKCMTSANEIIAYLPISFVKFIALLLLYLWTLSPIYIMLKSILSYKDKTIGYFVNGFPLALEWYIVLQQIGFVGCFILLFLLTRNFLNNHKPMRTTNYFRNYSDEILLMCLLIWSVFSTIASEDLYTSLNGTYYRRDGLISYFAYAGIFTCGYLMNSAIYVKKILRIFMLTSTFIAILMLVNVDTINQLLNFHPNSAMFYNINHFGYYLCLSIMAAVALFLIDKQSSKRSCLHLLCFAILVAALSKNHSFGPYVGVFSGIIFILLLSIKYSKENLKKIFIIASLFFLMTFIVNILTGFFSNELIKLFGDVHDIVKKTEIAGEAGSGRWVLWVEGIKFILEKPLFGFGPDNLGARYLLEGIEQDRPHNEFIQIAASLGIPALLFYISALIKHFSRLFVFRKNLNITIIALNSIILAYLASSLFGNTMFYTSPFYFMFLAIAISNTKTWFNRDTRTIFDTI